MIQIFEIDPPVFSKPSNDSSYEAEERLPGYSLTYDMNQMQIQDDSANSWRNQNSASQGSLHSPSPHGSKSLTSQSGSLNRATGPHRPAPPVPVQQNQQFTSVRQSQSAFQFSNLNQFQSANQSSSANQFKQASPINTANPFQPANQFNNANQFPRVNQFNNSYQLQTVNQFNHVNQFQPANQFNPANQFKPDQFQIANQFTPPLLPAVKLPTPIDHQTDPKILQLLEKRNLITQILGSEWNELLKTNTLEIDNLLETNRNLMMDNQNCKKKVVQMREVQVILHLTTETFETTK